MDHFVHTRCFGQLLKIFHTAEVIANPWEKIETNKYTYTHIDGRNSKKKNLLSHHFLCPVAAGFSDPSPKTDVA